MAHAFGEAGGGRLDVDAVQHLVEQQAIDAAPDPAQPDRRCLPELGDGEDAGAMKPLLHALADAVDVLQFETEQNPGQIVMRDDDQPVRLLQVGADLAEKDVRRDADRAGEALADLLAQGAFDLQRQFARDQHLALGSHQAAGHLVDRHDLLDRQAGVDGLKNALVIVAYRAGDWPATGMTAGHSRRASRTTVPVLMPKALAA